MSKERVAIIHDWLVSMRGGEKVLETVLEIFPQADIFTLVYDKEKMSDRINSKKITQSFLQFFPFPKKLYRHYVMFHPWAVESFDLRKYDIVISLSHCAAKGVLTSPESIHMSYMFTPMRYAYDMFFEYFNFRRFGLLKKIFYSGIFCQLRIWDYASSQRIDKILTISQFVGSRIKRCYNLDPEILYPPADTGFFNPGPDSAGEDFYLIVSALVPYKRVDLAISAFNRNNKKLVIIGTGPEYRKLKKLVTGNITFKGFVSDREVREYYRRAKGFIFPGKEDFGLTMVEANACGTPVIAYNGGGAAEIIEDGKNGILFRIQNPDSLNRAIARFEKINWDLPIIRKSSLRFSNEIFKQKFIQHLNQLKQK